MDNLLSANFVKWDESLLPDKVRSDLRFLRKNFPGQDISVLKGRFADSVLIPLKVSVNLPSRGPVGNIDIRDEEPICLQIDAKSYPYESPRAFSNRGDFPTEHLPHLNPASKGFLPSFCLHRGDINDWFSEHTIVDFVNRVRGWLQDAASDNLIRSEDEFEHTRIIDPMGFNIFDEYEILKPYKESLNSGENFGFIQFECLRNTKDNPLVKTDNFAVKFKAYANASAVEQIKDASLQYNTNNNQSNSDCLLIGILVWPPKGKVITEYFSMIPNRLGEFVTWCSKFELPLKEALVQYMNGRLQILGGIPITLLLPRPQKVISHSSEIEILSFVLSACGENWPKDGQWDQDSKIMPLQNRRPLTLRLAREISGTDDDLGAIAMLGCGSVGSKIALHLARGGAGNITFMDNDSLSPHNLIRHALLPDRVGQNKATALKETVEEMYQSDSTAKFSFSTHSAFSLISQSKEILDKATFLIDSTASNAVRAMLCDAALSKRLRYFRCEIADLGNVGLLQMEGVDRNPRMDDIQVEIYSRALDDPNISSWLQEHEKESSRLGSRMDEIWVGLSCNSDTFRLSDEIISFHSSVMANCFRNLSKNNHENGFIQISVKSTDITKPFVVKGFEIKPYDIAESRNGSSWQIRMRDEAKEEMYAYYKEDLPNETGGLLVGRVDIQRRIIHVAYALKAPPDSKKLPYCFERGISGVRAYLSDIRKKTGGLLDFVGEWHTHPGGGSTPSSTDRKAIAQIRADLDTIPYPTFITIVTKHKLFPYVYYPT